MTAGSTALRDLDRLRFEPGPESAPRKLASLRALRRAALPRAADVARFHDILCFLRAYPDDAAMLVEVEDQLERFAQRADLKRHRQRLTSSGIAGTATRFRFYAPTASWLAARHGDQLSIDWSELGDGAVLDPLLAHFSLYAETPGLDGLAFDVRSWIERLKGPRETDAQFLVRRFDALPLGPALRETIFDTIDLPFVLAPGPGVPTRTHAKLASAPVVFRTVPFRRERPALVEEIARPPAGVRQASSSEGREILELARGMMVTLNRDLDVFSYGSAEDVVVCDCDAGLQIAFVGFVPERRLLLETLYGYLLLQSGVPIGYGTVASLFESSEVAFNVSEPFRGAETAHVFARVLACARSLFGARSFSLDPYQIGDENEEAVATGAWWFYQKLGFRARDRAVLRTMNAELTRAGRSRRHRSTPATLRALAKAGVFFHLGESRADVLGALPLERAGLRVTELVARRFGSERERAAAVLADEAARLLGRSPGADWIEGEQLAFERWAPLVCVLPGVESWGDGDRAALVDVIRAKGGPRESEFVARFDRHSRLRDALAALVTPVREPRQAAPSSR